MSEHKCEICDHADQATLGPTRTARLTVKRQKVLDELGVEPKPRAELNKLIPIEIAKIGRCKRRISLPWVLANLNAKIGSVYIYRGTDLDEDERHMNRLSGVGKDICRRAQLISGLDWMAVTETHDLIVKFGYVVQWNNIEHDVLSAIYDASSVSPSRFIVRRPRRSKAA